MREFTYVVSDVQGLHALNAVRLSQMARTFNCKITVARGERCVDCKDMLQLLLLAARQGSELVFKVEGTNEDLAEQSLKEYIKEIL